MRRYMQILRAVARVCRARVRDTYNWPTVLVQECERLSGVYIKFLQMLASHETTKDLVLSARNDTIYEQVPYEYIDVKAELGDSGHYFRSVADTPFAAGSYGQVYYAELTSGERVIIKILRPSIRRTLRYDLRFLNLAASVIGWFTKSSIVNIHAITREFSRVTTHETDYLREARNGEHIRAYFMERGDSLIVPRSYLELSSRHVLVQQYIPGISLAAAMAEQRGGKKIDEVVYAATGSNIWQQLDKVGTELLNAIVYADYQMVDPHPGNIRLLPNNEVALIDFGMVAGAPRNRAAFVTMTGEMLKAYEDRFEPGAFAVAMLAFLDMELHDALQIVFREHGGGHLQSIEKFIAEYVRAQAGNSLTQHYLLDRQMARLFNQVINRGNKLGIRIVGENVMLQRSMNMFLSMVRSIGEEHGGMIHFELLRGIMGRFYYETIKQGFDHEPLPEMSDEQAYEVTANWLTMIAEKDRRLYSLIMERRFA